MDDHQISVELYHVLEFVGASEDARLIKRRLTNEAEMLDTITYYNTGLMRKFPRMEYIVGSYYEASVTPDLISDIDTVLVKDHVSVVTEPGQPGSYPLKFLLIQDDDTYPGYVKLQPVLLDEPLTIHSRMISMCLCECFLIKLGIPSLGLQNSSDRNGNICFISDCFLMNVNYFNMKKHGPAWAVYEEDGNQEFDHVFAFKCDRIPKFAKGWISRHRKNEWPCKQLLKEFSRTNTCLLVQKGHENSTESNLEWRISFTLQERKLMTSLNAVQHKVFVLLKMIKREIVQRNPELDGVISSYELKTCLLHVIENTPTRYWEKANLVICLVYTLSVFTRWIRNGHCPNFFIPEQNLFFRSSFKHKNKNLAKVFETLLGEKHKLVFGLNCDRINELLTLCNVNGSKQPCIKVARACFERLYGLQNQLHWFVASKVVSCSRSVLFKFRPHQPRHIDQVTRSIMQYGYLEDYKDEERCKSCPIFFHGCTSTWQ